MLHFFSGTMHKTNFSKFSSFNFKLMNLSDCTCLNIENDPSTTQELAGAYLSEDIWGKVSLYEILLGEIPV